MLARPASRMAVGSEVRYVSENQEGRMHPLKKAWAAIAVLGGTAVVGSYVWGLSSIPTASTDSGEGFGFPVFLWIYLAILVPSALWMPLVAQMVASPSEPVWWVIRLALLVVGLASVALVAALLRVSPRSPTWLYLVSVVGAVWFTVHTLAGLSGIARVGA